MNFRISDIDLLWIFVCICLKHIGMWFAKKQDSPLYSNEWFYMLTFYLTWWRWWCWWRSCYRWWRRRRRRRWWWWRCWCSCDDADHDDDDDDDYDEDDRRLLATWLWGWRCMAAKCNITNDKTAYNKETKRLPTRKTHWNNVCLIAFEAICMLHCCHVRIRISIADRLAPIWFQITVNHHTD